VFPHEKYEFLAGCTEGRAGPAVTSIQVMFALKVHSGKTHFNRQSLKQTAQVGRKTAKAVA